jgi:hypothetical protein
MGEEAIASGEATFVDETVKLSLSMPSTASAIALTVTDIESLKALL